MSYEVIRSQDCNDSKGNKRPVTSIPDHTGRIAVACLKSGTRGGTIKLRAGAARSTKGSVDDRGARNTREEQDNSPAYVRERKQTTRKVPLVMYGIKVMRHLAALPG